MLTEDLTVYRETYKLVSKLYDFIENYPKEYKFTLGQKLQTELLDLFQYISQANRDEKNRVIHLERFLMKFETVKVLIRLSEEKHALSITQAADITEIIISISK